MQPCRSLNKALVLAAACAAVARTAFVQLPITGPRSSRTVGASYDGIRLESNDRLTNPSRAHDSDWTTPLLSAAVAGLLLGLAAGPGAANALAKDDVDSRYLIKRLESLQREADDASKAAKELQQKVEDKSKALVLFTKLDKEREVEIKKLEASIKKNQETRDYVLGDLKKRIGAGDSSPEVTSAKASFEAFYKAQMAKEQQVKTQLVKERKTREGVIQDIKKTRESAKRAAQEAIEERQRVQDMLDELTERSPLPEY
eukprot:TRINITY_DN947_c0_g1_i1.p1 TRINITY_DN947_c0_g1~~TRINITY_DN947_c0_g1_i1.p1  ORF type:complete len:258 (-),score=75.24 TRINITY_DN947_c0_g1_i1:93-866(-)